MQNPKIYPKISIITPSFNQAEFLEDAIKSILTQEYPNLEYIIIDGGSTDGSIEIIKKYAHHLCFWCSEPDKGQYDALNKGFSYATGEIMGWLNSDDMQLPWTLKTVASIMVALPEVKWLTTLRPILWDYSGYCYDVLNIKGYSLEAFLSGLYIPQKGKRTLGFIQQESTFWHKSLWQEVGAYISSKAKLAGDFHLWCRFYSQTDLYGTHSPLAGFRNQAHQKSSNMEEYIDEAEHYLSEMRSQFRWKNNLIKNSLYNLRFGQILGTRNFITNIYGYSAKKVVRRDVSLTDAYWAIEEYKFM